MGMKKVLCGKSDCAIEIVKAFGLDPSGVRGIKFEVDCGSIAILIVEHTVYEEQVEDFAQILKKYKVVIEEIEEDKNES